MSSSTVTYKSFFNKIKFNWRSWDQQSLRGKWKERNHTCPVLVNPWWDHELMKEHAQIQNFLHDETHLDHLAHPNAFVLYPLFSLYHQLCEILCCPSLVGMALCPPLIVGSPLANHAKLDFRDYCPPILQNGLYTRVKKSHKSLSAARKRSVLPNNEKDFHSKHWSQGHQLGCASRQYLIPFVGLVWTGFGRGPDRTLVTRSPACGNCNMWISIIISGIFWLWCLNVVFTNPHNGQFMVVMWEKETGKKKNELTCLINTSNFPTSTSD